jgi:hypothetical protein
MGELGMSAEGAALAVDFLLTNLPTTQLDGVWQVNFSVPISI